MTNSATSSVTLMSMPGLNLPCKPLARNCGVAQLRACPITSSNNSPSSLVRYQVHIYLKRNSSKKESGYFFFGGTNAKGLSAVMSPVNLKNFRPLIALASMVSSMVGVRPLCF